MLRNFLGSALAALVLLLAANAPAFALPGDFQKNGVTIHADDKSMGSRNAPIMVMEYAAPSCPVCARFNQDAMASLKTYIDAGKVFYVFRVFPINGNIDAAVEGLARCLPDAQYFPFLDSMFRSQKDWDPEYGITDVEGALLTKAAVAGFDHAKAEACMRDAGNIARINRDSAEAVQLYKIRGTPTLIINNVAQDAGAMPWPTLKAKLDALLPRKK